MFNKYLKYKNKYLSLKKGGAAKAQCIKDSSAQECKCPMCIKSISEEPNIKEHLKNHVVLVSAQDGWYIYIDDDGRFYMTGSPEPITKPYEPFNTDYPLINAAWGTLVLPHRSTWEQCKLCLIFPYSDIADTTTIFQINAEDTRILSNRIYITENTRLVLGKTIVDHMDDYNNMRTLIEYMTDRVTVFDDYIKEYEPPEKLYESYKMLCDKYGIIIDLDHIIKKKLMDMYEKRKLLCKIFRDTKIDEKYFIRLKNTVDNSKSIDSICIIETIQNETLRNTVDKVIKENYKNIYILDYCKEQPRNRGGNAKFSACVRNIEDKMSSSGLKVPLHEIEIFKPYIFRNSISIYYETIPDSIFGMDTESLFDTRYFKRQLKDSIQEGVVIGKNVADKAEIVAAKEHYKLDSSIISEYIILASFKSTSEFLNSYFKNATDFMNRGTLIVNRLYDGDIFTQICNYVENNEISKEWIETWNRNFLNKFKFCATCGSSINDGKIIFNFCKKCGNKINYENPFIHN